MAMPWSRAKAMAAEIRQSTAKLLELNRLFWACLDIQEQASRAAGHRIPLVIENVKGAQPWVGPAKAHFGSFYLWGDVESVGGRVVVRPEFGHGIAAGRAQKFNPDGTAHGQGSWFAVADSKDRGARKVDGFNFHQFEQTGQPGGSFQSAAVAQGVKQGGSGAAWFDKALDERRKAATAYKVSSAEGRRTDPGKGARFTSRDCGIEGTKNGGDWFASGADCSEQRRHGSGSTSRKAASAMIARIPFDLARFIARSFYPALTKDSI